MRETPTTTQRTYKNSYNFKDREKKMKSKPYYKEFDAYSLQRVRSSWEDMTTTPDDKAIDTMRQDHIHSVNLATYVADERAVFFANQEMFDIIDNLEL